MKRPNLCTSTISIVDDSYQPGQNFIKKDEGRVSLMKRVLGGGSKKKDNTSQAVQPNKCFGVPLTELPLTNHGVPSVLHRITTFIESNGINVDGLFKMSNGCRATVDNLKSQFNKTGEADLENCGNISAVAALLKLWLSDLPQPLLSKDITSDLVSLMSKYNGDIMWGAVCYENLAVSGTLSITTLCCVLRLLHLYINRYPSSITYLPAVFCPLLTSADLKVVTTQETVDLTTKFIQDFTGIFQNKLPVEISFNESNENNPLKQTALVISEIVHTHKHRKRKERHESKRDSKFVRSNSEERPTVQKNSIEVKTENMRRVNSHEDFSKSPKQQTKMDQSSSQNKKTLLHPLQEHNTQSPERSPRYHSAVSYCDPGEKLSVTAIVGYASELYDENEHERRRSSERFAPQVGGRRHHRKPRRRTFNTKENVEDDYISTEKWESSTETELGTSPEQLENNVQNVDSEGDSTTPVTSSSEQSFTQEVTLLGEENELQSVSGSYSPTLDLNACNEGIWDSEPVTSTPHWNANIPNDDRMVSPRNSMVISSRRYTAGNACINDPPSFDLNSQIQSLKRKIKRFEEGYEREFNIKPTNADKMGNPEIRKMMSLLSKLRKVRQKKEETKLACFNKSINEEPVALSKKLVNEIEKHLAEKRLNGGRSEALEVMGPEELADEKVAIQKVLLQLEAKFGRPNNKEDKELVRPLYDRYRNVKRILLRYTPSKMKESVSELGTILEHETMDFSNISITSVINSSSPPRIPSPTSGERRAYANEIVLDNLHALPPNELLQIQRQTRDEKRRLKRNLRDVESDIASVSGRRMPRDECMPLPTYTDYKQAKAKLKFIDALVTKMK